MENEILTQAEAAKYLRISERTLRRWQDERIGPPFAKAGNKLIRYRKSRIDEWLDSPVGTEETNVLR
jgi:excisionase family DNA binding protein